MWPSKSLPLNSDVYCSSEAAPLCSRLSSNNKGAAESRTNVYFLFDNRLSNKKLLVDLIGFTLIEILISMAILAVIIASTFTIFKSASSSWVKGETRTERYHNARVALERINREISQAVVQEPYGSQFFGEREKLGFVGFISSGSGVFELAEVTYCLDNQNRILMRDIDLEPDFNFSTKDSSDPLAENITTLDFSYFDGQIWKSSWAHSLPNAVKVKIRVENPKTNEGEDFEIIARPKIL